MRVLTAANMVSILMLGSSQSPAVRVAPCHQEKKSSNSAAPYKASACRLAAPTSQGQVSSDAPQAAMAAGQGESPR